MAAKPGDRPFQFSKAELYVAPASGGEPVKVSGTLVTNKDGVLIGRVTGFKWSPDATRLAFRADKEVVTGFELYVAPAAGRTEPFKVSGTQVFGGDVGLFSWSPDGSRLAFFADKEIDEWTDLFVVTAAEGAEPVKPTEVVAPDSYGRELTWSPLSN